MVKLAKAVVVSVILLGTGYFMYELYKAVPAQQRVSSDSAAEDAQQLENGIAKPHEITTEELRLPRGTEDSLDGVIFPDGVTLPMEPIDESAPERNVQEMIREKYENAIDIYEKILG